MPETKGPDLVSDLATFLNVNVFQKIPVISDINKAGRVFGLQGDIE